MLKHNEGARQRDVLVHLRGDGLARTTPCCESIEDDDILICDGGGEFVLTVNHENGQLIGSSDDILEACEKRSMLRLGDCDMLRSSDLREEIVNTHIDFGTCEGSDEVVSCRIDC